MKTEWISATIDQAKLEGLRALRDRVISEIEAIESRLKGAADTPANGLMPDSLSSDPANAEGVLVASLPVLRRASPDEIISFGEDEVPPLPAGALPKGQLSGETRTRIASQAKRSAAKGPPTSVDQSAPTTSKHARRLAAQKRRTPLLP